MGVGFVSPGVSKKQKINTDSSTMAELVGTHDMVPPIMYTRYFMEEQGYPLDKNILHQDNKSAILLEVNGRKSAGKRSRHLNIRFFFITDQKEKKNLSWKTASQLQQPQSRSKRHSESRPHCQDLHRELLHNMNEIGYNVDPRYTNDGE